MKQFPTNKNHSYIYPLYYLTSHRIASPEAGQPYSITYPDHPSTNPELQLQPRTTAPSLQTSSSQHCTSGSEKSVRTIVRRSFAPLLASSSDRKLPFCTYTLSLPTDLEPSRLLPAAPYSSPVLSLPACHATSM